MAEEPDRLAKRDVVKKQLLELRAQHLHHIMVALGMSHPDLDNVDMHDQVIVRIDRALEYLQFYPKGGYTLKEEPSDSPRVFAFIQRFIPHLKKPSEPTDS